MHVCMCRHMNTRNIIKCTRRAVAQRWVPCQSVAGSVPVLQLAIFRCTSVYWSEQSCTSLDSGYACSVSFLCSPCEVVLKVPPPNMIRSPCVTKAGRF